MTEPVPSTAAMLAIGDEILSGRTKDRNIGHFAEVMTLAGIDLAEVRIVPDDAARIVEALNALRARYDIVVTSGGIGPTHDDITADAVGAAFGLPVGEHEEAVERLRSYYEGRDLPFTDARRRMTRTPQGASLIDNPVSTAPGFSIGNVHVMAGVPHVFQAMLENLVKSLPHGIPIESRAVACPLGEGDIGGPLAEIARARDGVSIGSYPRFAEGRYTTEIIIRSRDRAKLDEAEQAVRAMIDALS
ncbi:competence/damage-inducible protein A [Fulvimarina sp. 2208YS6-2-32]|uniref:Competence/damage-inducible protein A n=1 Tax=Fulvimarina uroteuthidis TaxID=3098149 RepID=A0ABU5HXC9_9HYPH|nr:competence/damage-inducible protein A [Fulvimarina sp. 2208YS6-2-32]MDY8107532.1 competence/damage-inducible protein A [Fulvimarina sp. 2208YS6-2-32]